MPTSWRIIDPDGDMWNTVFNSECAAWGQLCRFDDQRYETFVDRKLRYVARGYVVIEVTVNENVIK